MKMMMTIIGCLLSLLSFSQEDFMVKREQMVKTQLEARDISDSVTLKAMFDVKRHQFVPKKLANFSYEDRPLPIGEGQTISQPYIVAYMTQALQLKPTDRVLEIGTGSGYQAAVLSKIVDSVYTIEIVEKLAIEARDRLLKLGYDNVRVKWGDGYHGLPDKAPFDAIMVTAGAKTIPQPLIDQLKVDGHMIIPVGMHHIVSRLVLVTKKKRRIIKKDLLPVRFVPFTRDKTKK